MSCWHGNHEDACDLCDEKDDAFNRGYEAGMAKALAEPQQEPVVQCLEAIMELADKYATAMERGPFSRLYQGNIQDARANLQAAVEKIVTPPQRTWVGLTDEEITQGNKESWVTEQAWQSAVWWAEAKLKEKNGL